MSKPTTYTTQKGDTFSTVARNATGSDTGAASIKNSNPGATEPFQAGVVLQIPSPIKKTKSAFRPDGLDLRVGGVNIDTIDQFTFSSSIDGFRRCEFGTANEIQTRSILPVLNPLEVDIGYNGFPLMSGYMETPNTSSTEDRKSLTVMANSLPQVMLSPPPASAFPLEFVDSDLSIIANSLCKLYSVEPFFYSEPGARFKKVSIELNEPALAFLSKLSKQRATIIRDDEFGSAVFDNGTIAGDPVLNVDDETRPDVKITSRYSGTSYYSHVTGILKGKRGKIASSVTVVNPHYNGIIRPHQFEISDSDSGELETAVNSVAARMFAEVFQMSVTVPGWTDKNGNIFATSASMMIRSPKEYINEYTELLIRNVTLNADGQSGQKTATLIGVLPGVFSGIIPSVVPWT